MNANEANEANGFEFDNISNTAFEELQMIEQQRQDELLRSQQTSASTPRNVNPNPRQVVQRPIRPPKRAKTSSGRGGVSLAGGRRRTRTEFQEDIVGLGKRTSPVWDHFTIVPEKDDNDVVISLHAVCRHCKNTDYRAEGHYGTSNCRNHLKSCEPYQEWLAKNGDLIEAIMYHGYPLSMVEHKFTRKLHRYLNPKVKNISRSTITRWCMRKNSKLRKMLFETLKDLDSKVSLTCDIWTACTSRGYLTLTAHYIDKDWCLKSKVLNFCHFPPPSTGHAIYELVYAMIKDWGLESKVMCMTVDNATNNDSMIPLLQECLNDGLKAIDPAVTLVRDNVKYIDSSEARMNRFRDFYTEPDYTFKLTDREWESVENMASILEPFYEMTNLFSGSDYPTANLYFEQVCKAKYHLRRACESEDACIREMGN
uniref:BED-type domain-containing protein n=1 Tax=Amaranthus palmeri TaxID=107608 RepID=A0A6C0T505_AMAPA|nr:hypothetical protein AP_R.00g000180-v1.0.a3 [Amaranthus palmeri]